ncbi:hypothetical protein [Daejeonella lutea]|uniref:Uncharacterized protein n=1 Tax=Daejeonella lutea TaxID=572036 RepID=A0A1T4ZXF8_9SPHI|nr:hypothetical protein [Daejeonella lutea]SKB27179.1 hypothetical protein SAMN05661099_0026 [Daejeonella lutea]
MAAIDPGLIKALFILGIGLLMLWKPRVVSERSDWEGYIKIGGLVVLLLGVVFVVSALNRVSCGSRFI